MHADDFFTIGNSHVICDDYATSRADGPIRAVVSDGCSGSPNTDCGSRILANLALRNPNWSIQEADDVRRQLFLPVDSLDATLLIAEVDSSYITVSAYGDGVIAAQGKDGVITAWEIHFTSGAPLYPAYDLSVARWDGYLKAYPGERIVRGHRSGIPTVELDYRDTGTLRPTVGYRTSFSTVEYDLVAVMTDGATQFVRKTASETSRTTTPVPLLDIVTPLMNPASPHGVFVRRRVTAQLKRWAAEGIYPTDDFAMAAIWCGE